MKPVQSQQTMDANDEIAALIKTLLETERRLEELTAGEVDTVSGPDGRTFVLGRAQEQLRNSEAAKQAAILNALPAHIALLDRQGIILSVNEAWKKISEVNALYGPKYEVGLNYLEACDAARGDCVNEAPLAAAGIRSVLNGSEKIFSLEYACHSPIEQRWLVLTVTPMDSEIFNGVVVMHLNITARKHAEGALRASEAEFRTLSEAMPQIVWITRPDGGNVYFNRHWMEYTGLSLEESLGDGWNKPFHPEDQLRARKAWQHATATRDMYSLECRLRRADGVYRWWLIRGVPQQDPSGTILKWFGTCTDIHDLKMAELKISDANRALRESEGTMAAAQRIGHFGSWELMLKNSSDVDAGTLRWSDEMYRIAGYEPGAVEVNNALFFRLVPEDEHEPIRQAVAEAIRERKQYSIIHRIIRPGGENRTVQETAQILFDETTGQALKIVGTAMDITERIQAEEVLHRQQAELRALFHLMPAMIWFKDTENRILRVNQRAAESAGKPIAELEGRSMFDVYPQEAKKYFSDDQEVIRSGAPKLGIIETLPDRDGRELWIHTDKVPVRDKDGKIVGVIVMAQDITERKRAEEALRESEERFTGAFLFAPIGVALVSPDGHWLKVNRALCDLVGFTEAELLTRTFMEITHSKDLEADLEFVRQLLAGEINFYQMEKRYIHARGHSIAISLSVSLVRDRQGQPSYFIAQIQDITARKKAEALLLESEQRLALATGAAHIGIWDLDVVANKLVWNPQMYKLYGVREQDFSGAYDAWQNGLHPEDRLRAEAEFLAALNGEKDFHSEFRIVWHNGEVRYLEAHGVTQRAENGPATRMIGVNWDITERKRAEENIVRALALLRATLDSTADGILAIGTDRKILTFNQTFMRMSNIPVDVLASGDDNLAIQYVLNQLQTPEEFLAKILYLYEHPIEESLDTLHFKDGRVFERFSRPMLVDEQAYGRVWSFRDITERKRAETELQKTHGKLLEASRLAGKAEVATEVLHNVGNVLNSINVASTCVADSLRKSKSADLERLASLLRAHESDLGDFMTTDSKGKHVAGYITQLAEHLKDEQAAVLKELAGLQNNVEHIKVIVKMQQNIAKAPGVTESISLAELVEDALKINASGLIRHNIRIEKEFEELPPMAIEKHKLLQILINLVRNAKDACVGCAREDRRLLIRLSKDLDCVRIAVSDNGVGIPPEILTRIFAHGFTTKKDGHGFGLHSGVLAAQEMGGSLTVCSEGVGMGATFTIELPCNTTKVKK